VGRGDVDHGLVFTRDDRNPRPLDAESKRFQDLTAEAKSLGVKSSLTVDLLLRRRRKAGMIPRWRCG
jgi:hypothetical protein